MEPTDATPDETKSRQSTKDKPAVVSDDDSSDEEFIASLAKLQAPPVEPASLNRPKNTGFKVSFSYFPPSMTEKDFIEQFGPLPKNNYFFYKPPIRMGMMPLTCTAVINFLDKTELADWFEKLHGLVLTDDNGEEYVIDGQIMITQNLPKFPVAEKDPLEGTLEDTEEFQAFADLYDDTDGVFQDPPIPLEVLQETMLKEIEERKAKDRELQDTPLVVFFREKNKGEREKARIRDEKEAALRVNREKRRQERREQRDREKKDRREKEKQERLAKEKLRKEAARRAKRAKQKQVANEKGQVPPTGKEGDGVEVCVPGEANTESGTAQPGPTTTSTTPAHPKEGQTPPKNEVPSTSGTGGGVSGRGRDKGQYGGKSNRGSSKPWDRDITWSKRSNKWDQDKGSGGNWRKDKKSAESTPSGAPGGSGTTVVASTVPPPEPVSSSTPGAPVEGKKGEEKTEPKKKIVKKIIKVKKVRSSENVEGGEGGGGGSSSSKGKSPGSSSSAPANATTTNEPSTSTASDAPKQTDGKRKPNRPDREVYRPGAWRRNSGTGGGGGENRKPGSGGQKGQKDGPPADKPKPSSTGPGETQQ